MNSAFQLTHKQAVRRIARHLEMSLRVPVVIAELATQNTETPDILGFHRGAHSILVEVKVSRADFLADRGKRFRKIEALGMGDVRYFAAPKGMLSPEEIPEGWGLWEIDGERQVLHTKEADRKEGNKRAEVIMLASAIRRLELSTAVFVRHDPPAEVSQP